MKKSFTLLELVFIIIVLGVIATIAIPKFVDNLHSTNKVKLRSDISMIRANILEYYNNQLFKSSTSSYPKTLEVILNNLHIKDQWLINGDIYEIKLNQTNKIEFLYNNNTGKFDCTNTAQKICKEITQ